MLLTVVWAIQYIFVLGLPPALCIDYNWGYLFKFDNTEMLERFLKFMFLPELPTYQSPEKVTKAALVAQKLIPDFFQLLLAVCQCAVFDNEEKDEWVKLAGSNEDKDLDGVKENPYSNFILAEPPTTLDRAKTFVFSMIYWVTFTVVLIAGTNRTSAFCLGYLVAAFYFLYKGQVIITSMPSQLRKRWNMLLFFAGFVIVVKCCLQYVACVMEGLTTTATTENGGNKAATIVTALLSLTCERCVYYYDEESEKCAGIKENDLESTVGIVWDFATFVFLLIQRRIFQSYYFLHVRNDLIVQIALSSKGNQLFSLWINQEADKREKAELDDKARVEETIERIKSNLRKDLREPYDHFDALRVCDKSWFEGITEDIYANPRDTASSQIRRNDQSNPEFDENEPISVDLVHSHTADQLSRHDQSPKLPEGIRTFKNTLGHVLFTGRLQPEGIGHHESKETINEPVISIQPGGSDVDQFDGTQRITAGPNRELIPIEDDDLLDAPAAPGCGECMAKLGVEVLVYMTRVLNTRTQAYRSIIIQLKKDRQVFGQKMGASDLNTQASGSANETGKSVPDRNYAEIIKREALRPSIYPDRKKSMGQDGHREEQDDRSSSSNSENEINETVETVKFISPDDFDKDDHYVQRLLSATWYFGQFQIENVCYLLMLFNGMLNASLLSLPFLAFIFLWAMLSVPRPSKRFWVTAICYTCFVIFVKYVFSFNFYPWTDGSQGAAKENSPFFVPRIIGIEIKPHLKYLDIGQLLVLFFQRGLLKVHGLWENYDEHFDDEIDLTAPMTEFMGKTVNSAKKALGMGNTAYSNTQRQSTNSQNCCCSTGESGLKYMVALLRSPGRFYARLVEHERERKNTPTDVYIWMLGVDFICFIIIMFGYWAFGKHNADISGDITIEIKENVVPTSFLYLLFIHFTLILVGRAIYLKKNLVAKLVFHVLQVVAIHIWMFFFLPYITEIPFYKNHVAMSLYTFKALYFAFSSHQIKCGYPTRILQHFLTKKFNYVNLYVFIGYRICPFIIEFQNIMDWMFVESTMGISRWFMLTTIYHELYQIKCWRVLEKQFHYPRGVPRWPSFKYSGGGFLLILLILIMWFPLAFMSIVQTVAGVANKPKEASIKLTINGYETLYTSTRSHDRIVDWTSKEYHNLEEAYSTEQKSRNLGAQQYISRYETIDICSTTFTKTSKHLWLIPQDELNALLYYLENTGPEEDVDITLYYEFRRKPGLYEMASGYQEKKLNRTESLDLYTHINNTINNQTDQTAVTIHRLFPRYLRALTTNDARPITYLQKQECFSNLNLTLKRAGELYYWQIVPTQNPNCDPEVFEKVFREDEMEMIVFSDRTGPESLAWLTGYGVIGLYLSVTLLCGRYTRAIFQYDGAYILFHEYPNVDSLLQLCLDLYLVREMKLWKLEEDLMAKLIYLYRSPETMLPFTKLRPYKPKQNKTIKQE